MTYPLRLTSINTCFPIFPQIQFGLGADCSPDLSRLDYGTPSNPIAYMTSPDDFFSSLAASNASLDSILSRHQSLAVKDSQFRELERMRLATGESVVFLTTRDVDPMDSYLDECSGYRVFYTNETELLTEADVLGIYFYQSDRSGKSYRIFDTDLGVFVYELDEDGFLPFIFKGQSREPLILPGSFNGLDISELKKETSLVWTKSVQSDELVNLYEEEPVAKGRLYSDSDDDLLVVKSKAIGKPVYRVFIKNKEDGCWQEQIVTKRHDLDPKRELDVVTIRLTGGRILSIPIAEHLRGKRKPKMKFQGDHNPVVLTLDIYNFERHLQNRRTEWRRFLMENGFISERAARLPSSDQSAPDEILDLLKQFL